MIFSDRVFRMLEKLASWDTRGAQKILFANDSRKYPLKSWTSELGELFQAIRKGDKKNIKEEISDSLFVPQMMIYQRTGINMPLIGAQGAMKKFVDRIDVWKNIFKTKGLDYHVNYTQGGTNYKKPEKIRNAFSAAGYKISDDELRDLEPIVGKYELPI